MNFIISSSALLKHLTKVAGVIPTRSVLPIIENFLFDIKAGSLEISTTNLEISMQTSLPIESRGEPIKIAVPAKIILDILRALPEQPITFSVEEENFGIEISSENGKYKLNGENGLDFPKIPQPEETNNIELPTKTLLRAINNTLFAASTDEDKAALNGVLFDLSTNGVTFVSTDAHRLVRYRRLDITAPENINFIVPQKALSLVKNAFESSEAPLVVDYNDKNVFFTAEDVMLVCRLIDKKFPEYQEVIPTDNPGRLLINKKDLVGTLKRVNIFANKTSHQVRFKINGSELRISAEDMDFANEAHETLRCDYEGEDLEIGFNAALLLEVVNNASTDEILFELSTPGRAGLVLPTSQKEGENLLMLIMPVMLNTYAAV